MRHVHNKQRESKVCFGHFIKNVNFNYSRCATCVHVKYTGDFVFFSCPVMHSGDGIESPQRVLFPLEKLSLKWTQIHRVGAGLQNMGNTCFLNSALQCLTYIPPFANYMLTREHSKTCKPTYMFLFYFVKQTFCSVHQLYLCSCLSLAGHEPGFCMMCTMQNHITQVFANSGNVIKPIGVLNELKSK